MFKELDLSGRVALVTGAGRGIGSGIARALAEAGADVAVNALTGQFADPLVAEMQAHSGRRARAFPADVTDPRAVDDLVASVVAEFGRLDILVNGAGEHSTRAVMGEQGERLPDDEIRWMLDFNLGSAIYAARAAGEHLVRQGDGGRVINIASFASLRGGANATMYAAAKTGLLGFTRALALEWAPHGITVNAIAPGMFPDPLTVGDEGYRRSVESAKTRIPLGRPGTLREVGLLGAYLASDAAGYVTGQAIYIDGGMTL